MCYNPHMDKIYLFPGKFGSMTGNLSFIRNLLASEELLISEIERKYMLAALDSALAQSEEIYEMVQDYRFKRDFPEEAKAIGM